MCEVVEHHGAGNQTIAAQWREYQRKWAEKMRLWNEQARAAMTTPTPTPPMRRERPHGKSPMIETPQPSIVPVSEDWYEVPAPPPSQEYHSTYYDDYRDIPECSHRRASMGLRQ